MAKDTFKISTEAAPACGPNGAQKVAFKIAAIEVISRGSDRFMIIGDQSSSDFNYWRSGYNQGIIVRIINQGDPQYSNALSAREELGANWQEIVNKGTPLTCA